jgi:hypothetical protein
MYICDVMPFCEYFCIVHVYNPFRLYRGFDYLAKMSEFNYALILQLKKNQN